MVEVECGGFTFTSNFESGNMARVEQVPLPPKPPPLPGQSSSSSDVPDYEFNIWTNPDCAGTEFENSNRSWFYFGIRGGTPFALVKLNLVNLNRQVKMYSQGMAPVFRILPGRGLWDRIREKPTYTIEDNVFTLSFKYRTLENIKATTYFAFTFPYSYQDLMSSLRGFDKRFKNCPPPERYFPGQGFVCNPDDIYYHREVASFSLDGRRLDLLTITSHHGITPYREPRLRNLFPDLETPRPYIFSGKKVIFVSARVHPGEVPSSYVLNGLLESLLNRDDLTSILLRRMYVFKVIPMLNPDGVARGHFRTDTRGVNLNRVYLNPSLVYHPTIYAARAIIRYAHFGQEVNDDVSTENDILDQAQKLQSHPETPNNAVLMENNEEVCQDIRLEALSTCNQSSNFDNLMQPLSSSLQTCEPLNVIDGQIIIDKDVNMLCDLAQPADEELLNSDDNNMSQGSSDPIEMEVEKEKIEKAKNGIPDVQKGSFCATFPSTILGGESLDDHQFATSPELGKDLETNADIDMKNKTAENTEVSTLKKCANNVVSCDENMGPEEVRRRKEMKRKPGPNETSKPIRIFARPVSRAEDDGKNDEVSTCHGNNIGACMNGTKPSLDPSKSGLFLYMDMHGHASKKGIFMYGNHFDDLEQLVECMLLPKLMSINSQNFHFTACNFTERNMYLRDRRDGTSREGCGRVSVMKLTGLVRSYTLECNYNTGRMVNLLPPCVRDSGRMSVNPAYAVPPKYTPLVFEEVGRALGVSVLDLTSSNPCSRIPNSEYRSISGIRDWLRSNCLSDSQLWTRMLHRPTRPQVSQSSSAQMVSSSSGQKPIHLTKSVLLARISTELKSLGEEYARKEQIRIQKTSSCSQLDSMEGIIIPPPKENIGPGQSSSRSRRVEGALQAKASTSGILQQRAKTLSVANLATTSRKKQKSSTASSGGPLRPVPKSKGFRRSKTQESAIQNSSASGDSVFNDEAIMDSEAKNQTSLELCATPKRLKVSSKGMSGKLRRKPAMWTVKSMEEEEKTESHSDAAQLLWATNRNPVPPAACKKTAITSKIEKNSRTDLSKFRSGVFSKVKSMKKLAQPDSANLGENNQIKIDDPSVFVKLVDKLPGTKVTKLSTTETFKNAGPSVSKDWAQSKNLSRNVLLKAGKVDLSLPGPSSGEQSGFEGNQFAGTGTSSRVEQKLKSSVLRSLEKGAKSRLLCPVRRRSNEGKKSRKSVDRKSSCTENNLTSVCALRNDAASDNNCAN